MFSISKVFYFIQEAFFQMSYTFFLFGQNSIFFSSSHPTQLPDKKKPCLAVTPHIADNILDRKNVSDLKNTLLNTLFKEANNQTTSP